MAYTRLHKALAVNSTSITLAAAVPTTTRPAKSATISVVTPTYPIMHILPFGTDAGNELGVMRVIGWNLLPGVEKKGSKTLALYVPYEIGQFIVTYGSQTGVAGTELDASQFLADTITEVASSWDDNLVTVLSPANNIAARAQINVDAFDLIQIDFDRDASSGTAASMNALFWFSTQ